MTIPTLTSAPDAPLRSEAPATFTAKAEAFVDWQADFPTEMNTVIDEINALSFSTNSWKGAVRVATTANGTLATAFAAGQTVDGVTLATGDRILLKNQSTQSENGVYIVAASGAPTRAADMDENDEVLGAVVFVYAGTANGGKLFYSTNTAAVTVGSSNLTFAEFTGSGASLSGTNTWTGKQTFSAGAAVTPAATPATNEVGYLGAPQNLALDSGNYTLVMGDAGKSVDKTTATARQLTIPANGSVAFPVGTIICGSNEGSGALTIAITTDTLRWGSSTGSRTVAQHGSWTLRKLTSTVWRLVGDGIT